MENLGYKEGFAKPKKAKMIRRNSKISGEDVPLFAVNQKYLLFPFMFSFFNIYRISGIKRMLTQN